MSEAEGSIHDQDDEKASGELPDDEPRVPDLLGPADVDSKRFMTRNDGPSLKVRVFGGAITKNYGPAALLGELATLVAATIEQFSGGRTMLYSLESGKSMILYFGDPQPDGPQEALPVHQTHSAAVEVAQLIELPEESIFERAVEMGSKVRSYDALTRFVVSEDVTLDWTPGGSETAQLRPARANAHHEKLNAEPKTRDREMTVNGLLYRVIEDPVLRRGRIGIGMFDWSPEPPGYKAPGKVLLEFEGDPLHRDIKELIGEPVQAQVIVREPMHGTAIDINRVHLILKEISRGEGEASAYGLPLLDADDL